jgi:hypothetical protein
MSGMPVIDSPSRIANANSPVLVWFRSFDEDGNRDLSSLDQ